MNKISKIYQSVQEWLRVNLGSRITSAFLIMLGLAVVLWYVTKLQYTYTAKVPITVTIGDHRHRVECVVEGTGHNIVSARYFRHKKVKLKYSDVELVQVDEFEGTYQVSPESLQRAITGQFSDLKLVSVGNYPFVEID